MFQKMLQVGSGGSADMTTELLGYKIGTGNINFDVTSYDFIIVYVGYQEQKIFSSIIIPAVLWAKTWSSEHQTFVINNPMEWKDIESGIQITSCPSNYSIKVYGVKHK